MRPHVRGWLERHAPDFLILAAFGVGYLLGALVPEAGQVIALAGAVLIVARQLERHGGPWAP
jgi:hypothetical protein